MLYETYNTKNLAVYVCLFVLPVTYCTLKCSSHSDSMLYETYNASQEESSCLCLFVCSTGRAVSKHTWVLMGPDSNKMLKPGCKHASQVGSEKKRERERERERETNLKSRSFMRLGKTMVTPNKSSLTVLLSAFGTRERRFGLHPISIAS